MTSAPGDARAVIGRIAGTFGLRGEVKVATSDPSDFRPGLRLRATGDRRSIETRQDSAGRELIVSTIRPHQDRLLVHFEGVDDATAAEALRGCELSALISDLPEL
ncbi:MAG TPA: hypothetical protein VEV38_09495, partial [Candidatus Eremiobacteraceae bacterium]|nr:hypothetical protein [Candidatus Eremiobacteraceae bacterium]